MQTSDNIQSRPNYNLRALVGLFLISGFIFSLDQLTKTLVANSLSYGQSWAPIPALERLFQFTYITNTGAAFGLFSSGGLFFVIIAILVSIAIVYFYPYADNWLVRISLGLQLGGALGNLWDRIFNNGEVIDYVDLGFWPIFNIADISIVTGITVLAIWLWQQEDQQQQA